MTRRLVATFLGLTVLIILAGCTGDKPDPAASQSALAAARIQAASDCLDTWLNTQAPQSTIDAGLTPRSDGQRPFQSVIIRQPDGRYHADTTAAPFDAWTVDNNVPWERITSSILHGTGCPYTVSQ